MSFKKTEELIAKGPVFKTASLTYGELVQKLNVADAQRRRLEEEIRNGSADLFLRRMQIITAGAELPGTDAISGLPGWKDQLRREQIAHSNREADEAARRAGLLTRS